MEFVTGTAIFSSTSTFNIGSEWLLAGAGNLIINGLVSGGSVGGVGFYRWSGSGIIGEIVLNNPNNAFVSDVYMSGGFLGVSAQGDLRSGYGQHIDPHLGGTYDLRADPVNVNFDLKTYDAVPIHGTIIAARSVGGAGINQTITLGGAIVNNTVIAGFNDATTAVTTTFGNSNGSGNDGYGVTVNSGATAVFLIFAGAATGITSNLNGLLTINGSLSTSYTATSTNTITASGEMSC